MADTRPLQDYPLGPFLIANISAASQSQKIPVPMKGQVVGICVVQVAQTTSAAGVITARKNGVAMTSVAQAAPVAAAGTVTTSEISPNLATGAVDEGDEIDIDTDGGTTGAGVATVMLRIRL